MLFWVLHKVKNIKYLAWAIENCKNAVHFNWGNWQGSSLLSIHYPASVPQVSKTGHLVDSWVGLILKTWLPRTSPCNGQSEPPPQTPNKHWHENKSFQECVLHFWSWDLFHFKVDILLGSTLCVTMSMFLNFKRKHFRILKWTFHTYFCPTPHPTWNRKCLQASGGTLEE